MYKKSKQLLNFTNFDGKSKRDGCVKHFFYHYINKIRVYHVKTAHHYVTSIYIYFLFFFTSPGEADCQRLKFLSPFIAAYLSFIAICSSMADPVFAFQFPDIDFLLQRKKNLRVWFYWRHPNLPYRVDRLKTFVNHQLQWQFPGKQKMHFLANLHKM